MAQGALIRAGRIDEVDWQNVAEEIETMGRNEYGAFESHLMQVILHMLKWDVQPERRSRSWYVSIGTHRISALKGLRKNPGFKTCIDEIVADALDDARRYAALETGIDGARFDQVSYDYDTIINRPFEWEGEV